MKAYHRTIIVILPENYTYTLYFKRWPQSWLHASTSEQKGSWGRHHQSV